MKMLRRAWWECRRGADLCRAGLTSPAMQRRLVWAVFRDILRAPLARPV